MSALRLLFLLALMHASLLPSFVFSSLSSNSSARYIKTVPGSMVVCCQNCCSRPQREKYRLEVCSIVSCWFHRAPLPSTPYLETWTSILWVGKINLWSLASVQKEQLNDRVPRKVISEVHSARFCTIIYHFWLIRIQQNWTYEFEAVICVRWRSSRSQLLSCLTRWWRS